ncbi:hypothetical protein TSACC_2886 [Terrimicrobium sacchariphilum]|uniref:Uncharacterized protein n=1 Tax=Terrimicrobium sacchariphilum TaxID=690879 RepID=A0A146G6B4_TERSA|nr:hypothetical protein TSACC_2886 [Terrimicrobium sacchariphilum]
MYVLLREHGGRRESRRTAILSDGQPFVSFATFCKILFRPSRYSMVRTVMERVGQEIVPVLF